MTGEQERTVQTIEETRRLNNNLWMTILTIALESAPEKTKTVLRQINQNDRFISEMLMKLSES